MQKVNEALDKIMLERFGKDSLIALATVADGKPYVRTVDSFYEDGAFYVLTYELSNKMQQLRANRAAAVCGEWFTARGEGKSLGWFCKPENKRIADKMRSVFSAWIDNGHNNFDDENTCILKITLTDGVLFSDGKRYDIDFT